MQIVKQFILFVVFGTSSRATSKVTSSALPSAFSRVPRFLQSSAFYPTAEVDSIDNYEIVRYLDQGRHSVVFDALHRPTKTPVVIKVLRSRSAHKISRETDILQTVQNCSGVIRLLWSSSGYRFDYLVFESIGQNCQPLRHDSRQPLSVLEVKVYMHLLLTALKSCHEKNVMHRDIKPRNIIINRDLRLLRLLDFGLR